MVQIADLLEDNDLALRNQLRVFQDNVDQLPEDKDRPAAVDALWRQYSRQVFFQRSILPVLKRMCGGIDRCGYCENSTGHTCEHLRPKAHYPQDTFVWKNYLAICGDCNTSKNDNWAVLLDPPIGSIHHKVHVVEGRNSKDDVPVRPPDGIDILVNPRDCNPMDSMQLLIVPEDDKMEFAAMVPDSERMAYETLLNQGEKLRWHGIEVPPQQVEWHRAFYTIFTLKLNRRPELPRKRHQQYSTYKERLHSYIQRRNEGASEERLAVLKKEFLLEDHPSVWYEIKRCHQNGSLSHIDPDFHDDLLQAPEALIW